MIIIPGAERFSIALKIPPEGNLSKCAILMPVQYLRMFERLSNMLFSLFLASVPSECFDGFLLGCSDNILRGINQNRSGFEYPFEVMYMKIFDLTKFLNIKKIFIFPVLLIMFSIVPGCALAEEKTAQPSLPEEDFDTMQSRMTESVDMMIVTLENSTEDLDADSLASAEELISGLTSVKEEISKAETESDLQTIREELDALLEEAPEELKSIPGFGMGPGPGQSQNGSQVPPQGSGNMSEGRPEMPDGANPMDKNAMDGNSSVKKQETPGQTPAEQENADVAEDGDKDTSVETGFFGKLINSLKALFS